MSAADQAAAVRAGGVSARELVEDSLAEIERRDGEIGAFVALCRERALAEADRVRPGDPRPLCGVPIGLKDLYAVAGKPLTASSRLLHEVPDRHCDVWARLETAGMVLLGHLHTHEFAVGGTTDQVGSPWSLDRSAGGSSGGSGAALAARMVPAATGTDDWYSCE